MKRATPTDWQTSADADDVINGWRHTAVAGDWRPAAHKKPAHTHNAPALIGINAKYIIGEWFYLTDYIYTWNTYIHKQGQWKKVCGQGEYFITIKALHNFTKMGKLGILFPKKAELKATSELSSP